MNLVTFTATNEFSEKTPLHYAKKILAHYYGIIDLFL